MKPKKLLLFKLVMVLLTYGLVELVCFTAIRSRFIPAQEPTFSFVWNNPPYPLPAADIHPVWGTWHYKEPFRSQQGCLDFRYRINSVGARDRERAPRSRDKSRVVILGDSFIEGFGLPEEERLSNILEKKTGREWLNFACSDFGPTQEFLVYSHLARTFDHGTVVLGLLPFNDFENEDTALYRNQNRYKPYFVRTDTGYRLEYHKPTLEESDFNREKYRSVSNGFRQRAGRFLRAYTWWFCIADFFANRQERAFRTKNEAGALLSWYHDFRPDQLHRLEYVLRRLREAAPGKRIVVFTIPALPDFIRSEKEKPPLPGRLQAICTGLNIEYTDLLAPMQAAENDPRRFFLHCDQHWSAYANRTAAAILENWFSSNRNIKKE